MTRFIVLDAHQGAKIVLEAEGWILAHALVLAILHYSFPYHCRGMEKSEKQHWQRRQNNNALEWLSARFRLQNSDCLFFMLLFNNCPCDQMHWYYIILCTLYYDAKAFIDSPGYKHLTMMLSPFSSYPLLWFTSQPRGLNHVCLLPYPSEIIRWSLIWWP